MAQLRAHYEKWWTELEPLSLGAEAQPAVTLTSADWQDVYADNSRHVRNAAGGLRGGHWNVKIERAGDYEILAYRWPPEEAIALTAPHDAAGKALPIAGAKFAVAGQQLAARAEPGAKSIALRAQLPAGETRLQGWFVDAAGKELSGTFYTTVRRLN